MSFCPPTVTVSVEFNSEARNLARKTALPCPPPPARLVEAAPLLPLPPPGPPLDIITYE